MTLLAKVLDRLRDEHVAKGKERQFDALKPFLGGESEPGSYEQAARALGMSEGAAKVAVHRMRGRYRSILRAEIAETVSDSGEVDDEIRSLRSALG